VRQPIPVPPEASDVVISGPRPFVTSVEYSMPDGHRVTWTARRHRKGIGRGRGLTWVIGVLFAVGSTCFVLGPIPAYASLVGPLGTTVTFFVGSLVFTSAAYLSYLQVVREAGHRWFAWLPHDMGFWAVLVQLVGTVYFNITTFAAFFDVPPDVANRVIWRPDAIGSLCFLVASAIAFAEAGHRWWSWRPGERDWHITALNLWGSVFFGVSAVGAYVVEGGDELNAAWANGGTFLGAVCFLVASLLMVAEGPSNRRSAGAPETISPTG